MSAPFIVPIPEPERGGEHASHLEVAGHSVAEIIRLAPGGATVVGCRACLASAFVEDVIGGRLGFLHAPRCLGSAQYLVFSRPGESEPAALTYLERRARAARQGKLKQPRPSEDGGSGGLLDRVKQARRR